MTRALTMNTRWSSRLVALAAVLAGFADAGAQALESSLPATLEIGASTPSDDKAAGPAEPGAAASEAALRKSEKQVNSYALGMNIGLQLKKLAVEVDLNPFMHGLNDVLAGSKTRLTDKESSMLVGALVKEQNKKQIALRADRGQKNVKEGQAFLAANKSKEGVVALPSGLQYRVVKAGDGKRPTPDDTVLCNYRGTLLDGTEFDNSSRRDGPASFALGQVIRGWSEALQLMPVGSKWQLFVPPELAYGERGAGQHIAPGATLVFEVELVGIKSTVTAQTGKAPAR